MNRKTIFDILPCLMSLLLFPLGILAIHDGQTAIRAEAFSSLSEAVIGRRFWDILWTVFYGILFLLPPVLLTVSPLSERRHAPSVFAEPGKLRLLAIRFAWSAALFPGLLPLEYPMHSFGDLYRDPKTSLLEVWSVWGQAGLSLLRLYLPILLMTYLLLRGSSLSFRLNPKKVNVSAYILLGLILVSLVVPSLTHLCCFLVFYGALTKLLTLWDIVFQSPAEGTGNRPAIWGLYFVLWLHTASSLIKYIAPYRLHA